MEHLLKEELLSFNALSQRIKEMGVSRGASLATIHRWRSRGQLGAVRIGGVWYTSFDEFRRFVERRNVKSSRKSLEKTSVLPDQQDEW